MGVSLFTARVVFSTLGEENYGLYSLVAGFIVLFSFLNQSLTVSTQRFITYEIGRGTAEDIRKVFSISVINHIIIGFVILLLAETVGLWFINEHLNIPSDRMVAANWVFQLSVFTAIAGVLQTPYNALIIANEKMSIYAYFSFFDVVLKLAVIYLVQAIDGDKLVVYALLMFISSILNLLPYRIYCSSKFKHCRFRWFLDGKLMRQMFFFSGWNLFGQSTVVASGQGVNILINIYFDLSVNAALGIANTVGNAVNGFVTNFQNAFSPQLTKSYASGDFLYLNSLINRASKLSFYLIMLVGIPVIVECDYLLKLWLADVPEHATHFCQMILLCMMIDCFSNPLYIVIYASGKIRKYQLFVSVLFLTVFLFTWLSYHLGAIPECFFIYKFVFASVVSLCIRIFLISRMPDIRFDYVNYTISIVIRSLIISGIVLGIAFGVRTLMFDSSEYLRLLSVIFASLLSGLVLISTIGLNKDEFNYINVFVKRKIKFVLR